MTKPLEAGLQAVRATPHAPDAAGDDARVEAIAREIYSPLTGYKIFCFDKAAYQDERIKAEVFARKIIAADPATSRIRALEEANRALVEAFKNAADEICVANCDSEHGEHHDFCCHLHETLEQNKMQTS